MKNQKLSYHLFRNVRHAFYLLAQLFHDNISVLRLLDEFGSPVRLDNL